MAYFLPCAHIFLCDMYFSLQEQLTGDAPSTSAENAAIVWKFGDDEWKDFYSDWEECGYETYFKWETFTAEISKDRIPVLNCDFKETSEIFQSIYYSIELNDGKRAKLMAAYRKLVDDMKDLVLEDSIKEHAAYNQPRKRKCTAYRGTTKRKCTEKK